MENPTETLSDPQINGPDPPNNPEISEPDHVLLAELESLFQLHQTLLSKAAAMEEESNIIRKQRDDALARNAELTKVVGEISGERETQKLEGFLREKEDGFASKLEEELKTKEAIEDEVRVCRETIERLELEKKERDGFLLKCLDSLRSTKEGIIGIIDGDGDEKAENGAEEAEGTGAESEFDPEWRAVWEEIAAVARLAASAEAKVSEYKELRKKEKKELEKSVVSLTEENRDISSLLRVALVEKKLKGNSELEVVFSFYGRKVEELMIETKESEAEVARWREACELEVEAGKTEIGEREKVITILKQELEKTKTALDVSNGKLKLKEELAATAMAAQAAAERSLQLTDIRTSGLRKRIEELSKQVEEAESRERNNRRVRRICWPWRPLKAANTKQDRACKTVATGNASLASLQRVINQLLFGSNQLYLFEERDPLWIPSTKFIQSTNPDS